MTPLDFRRTQAPRIFPTKRCSTYSSRRWTWCSRSGRRRLGSSVGSTGGPAALGHRGRLFISLKPSATRDATTQRVIARLRGKLNQIPASACYFRPGPARRRPAERFAISIHAVDSDIDSCRLGCRACRAREQLPQTVDVTTDREQGGCRPMSPSTAKQPHAWGARPGHRQRT